MSCVGLVSACFVLWMLNSRVVRVNTARFCYEGESSLCVDVNKFYSRTCGNKEIYMNKRLQDCT